MPVRRLRVSMVVAAVMAAASVVPLDDPAGAQIPPVGSLSISVPASVNLSTGTPINATSLSATMGNVTVTDTRVSVLNGWTATVASTDFTTGAGSTYEKIPRASVSYWSGTATATTGTGVFVPGQATALLATPLSGTVTAFSVTGVVAGTSATWRPTIVVGIPTGVVVGTYQGTITHSVS
jgi:hypothetical protein